MKKILLTFLILFFYLGPAQAGVMITDPLLFNFQGGNGEILPIPFASSSPHISIIEEDATFINPNLTPEPWLNGPVGNGGLGVCILENDCMMGASAAHALEDDETLTLRFDTDVSNTDPMRTFNLTRIYFLNANSGTDFNMDAEFGLSINGGTAQLFPLIHVFDFAMEGFAVPTIANLETITFFWGGDLGGNGQDFFIAGLVPIPAALPLFISGLLGFAFFSRRRAAAR